MPNPPAKQRFILLLLQDMHFDPVEHRSLAPELFVDLRRKIEDAIQAPPEQVEIDVWLESPGGDAHTAYKIALLLRAYATKVRAIVPDYAKSAATLLALAADEIYMAPAAELGPLDAQVPNEGGIITMISALDMAKSLDDLTTMAMEKAFNGGAFVLQVTGLSRSQSLSAMLDFAAKFMEPIVRQLDPKMIHWANSLLDVSLAYGERILSMRTAQGPRPDVSKIPRSLVEAYPTHGFVISRDEATDLGLPVQPISEYDYTKQVIALHRMYEDGRRNIIELMNVDDLDSGETANGGEQGAEEPQ